jgi:hypothetical protein
MTTHRRAQCSFGSEEIAFGAALRCSTPPGINATFIYDPCFARHGDPKSTGAVIACAEAPGSTTFLRFVTVRLRP